MKPHKSKHYERYEFASSPWVQDLTQRDLAKLLGTSKDQLEALIRDKERWISRQIKPVGKKQKLRQLAIPSGKLRRIHERLKFHLNKIKQPPYLFSPRKGCSQRDNAAEHRGQNQFLSIDICQFYPSTSSEHIFQWAHHVAGLRSDVAGMLTRLVSIDEKMPFGSPISPVLTALVHRQMFDNIYTICQRFGLQMSLWVDNVEISGKSVPGEIIEEIRSVIRGRGLKSHDIEYRNGGRPVTITGIPIEGSRIVAPRDVHVRIHNGYQALRGNMSDDDRMTQIDTLLSALGTYRYILGASSPEGRKAADQMYALRRRRKKLSPVTHTPAVSALTNASSASGSSELPWAK